MGDEIPRPARIDARSIDSDAADACLLRKVLGGVMGKTWKVEICRILRDIAAEIPLFVRPELGPSREEYHERAGGDSPIAALMGLRISEIVGLQWGDFDWENETVLIQRGVVNGRVGETKTEYSQRPLPMDPVLKEAILRWRSKAHYLTDTDWVFAADSGKPRSQTTILKKKLKPAAERAGIGKIGWHTFRHTYSTLLRASGADIKVQQELLRHADIQTTMNIYTQAVSDAKREANHRVIRMVLPEQVGPKTVNAAGGSVH